MKYTYHKWFYFIDSDHEIDTREKPYTYFKTYFEEILGIYVSIRINNAKEADIYYHDALSVSDLKDFHSKNYPDRKLLIVKHNKNAVNLESYINYEFSGLNITNFNRNKLEISNLSLDENHRLIQYCEVYYNENNEAIKEKYFYATKHWQIHEENLNELG